MYKTNDWNCQNIQVITSVWLLKKILETTIHNLDFTLSVFSDSHGKICWMSILKINLSGSSYFLKNDE